MIPLICLDVDGTLVGESGVVTDAVWSATDAARSRGQHLALCTARGAFGSSWTMAQRLDPDGWHVFHAGGAVVHSGTADVRSHPIEHVLVTEATDIAAHHDWILEFYTATDYVVASSAPIAVDHAALMGVEHRARPLSSLDTTAGGIVRLQFVVDATAVPDVEAATQNLGLQFTSATSPIMPGAAFVSLTAPLVTKATGIRMIADELGLTMADVMMVGDGHNDLPALAAVGVPVAMGNAIDEVKALSSFTVEAVESNGVVDAVKRSAELDPN